MFLKYLFLFLEGLLVGINTSEFGEDKLVRTITCIMAVACAGVFIIL